MLRPISFVLGLWWLLVVGAVFATQNPQPIELNFLAWQSVPLPAGIVLIWLSGLSAFCFSLIWNRPAPRSPQSPPPNVPPPPRETQVRSRPVERPRRSNPRPPMDDWEARTNDWDNW